MRHKPQVVDHGSRERRATDGGVPARGTPRIRHDNTRDVNDELQRLDTSGYAAISTSAHNYLMQQLKDECTTLEGVDAFRCVVTKVVTGLRSDIMRTSDFKRCIPVT